MAVRSKMMKWGNSLAVRIPKTVADEAHIREGDNLMVEAEAQGTVALKLVEKPITLDDLLAGITPENLHREQDWGLAGGNEVW
jgi:antitoxin MazE